MFKNLFLIFLVTSTLALVGCSSKKGSTRDDDPFGNLGTDPEIGMGSGNDYQMGDMPLNYDQDGFYGINQLADPVMRADAQQAFQTIYFNFNDSSLTQPAQSQSQNVASFMKKYPNVLVKVEGHCDVRGEAEYNMGLGSRRAMSVIQYVVDLGVPSVSLFSISYGKEKPVDLGTTEEAHSKNRRAQFLVKLKGQ